MYKILSQVFRIHDSVLLGEHINVLLNGGIQCTDIFIYPGQLDKEVQYRLLISNIIFYYYLIRILFLIYLYCIPK